MPPNELTEAVHAAVGLMKPKYHGSAEDQASQAAQVQEQARAFLKASLQILPAAERLAAASSESMESFYRGLQFRADFENRPLDRLYFKELNGSLAEAIDALERNDPRPLQRAIDDRLSESLRGFDQLLSRGWSRLTTDGGLEHQGQVVRGIEYSVRTHPEGRNTLRVTVPATGDEQAGFHLSIGAGADLGLEELQRVGLLCSFGDWQRVEPKLIRAAGETWLQYDVALTEAPWVSRPEAVFSLGNDRWLKDGDGNLKGPVLAVPQAADLPRLQRAYRDYL
jgi:hypothetical protein